VEWNRSDLRAYYGAQLDECHLPFNFHLISLDWNARLVREFVDAYDAILPPGAWPNWVIGNHDRHRVATRLGAAQARVANMLLLTLRGTPTTYYGEEIGMKDGEVPAEYVQDPWALKQPEIAHIIGRDPARTPMQWDDSPNAGFAAPGARTWLPVAGNYARCNVALQSQDPTSMLSLYRALTQLRRAEPSLAFGDYQSLDAGVEDVFAYVRRAPNAAPFLVVLNFSGEERIIDLSRAAVRATIAVSTDMRSDGDVQLGQLVLSANQGLVLRLPQVS
jgi:alpha-glucosidase